MITRKIDHLGRFNIPKRYMIKLGFEQFQRCEITIEYGYICIKAFDCEDIKARSNVGIVRCLDDLNRIKIPKEYLEVLDIQKSTTHQVFLGGLVIRVVPEEVKEKSSQ